MIINTNMNSIIIFARNRARDAQRKSKSVTVRYMQLLNYTGSVQRFSLIYLYLHIAAVFFLWAAVARGRPFKHLSNDTFFGKTAFLKTRAMFHEFFSIFYTIKFCGYYCQMIT